MSPNSLLHEASALSIMKEVQLHLFCVFSFINDYVAEMKLSLRVVNMKPTFFKPLLF